MPEKKQAETEPAPYVPMPNEGRIGTYNDGRCVPADPVTFQCAGCGQEESTPLVWGDNTLPTPPPMGWTQHGFWSQSRKTGLAVQFTYHLCPPCLRSETWSDGHLSALLEHWKTIKAARP